MKLVDKDANIVFAAARVAGFDKNAGGGWCARAKEFKDLLTEIAKRAPWWKPWLKPWRCSWLMTLSEPNCGEELWPRRPGSVGGKRRWRRWLFIRR